MTLTKLIELQAAAPTAEAIQELENLEHLEFLVASADMDKLVRGFYNEARNFDFAALDEKIKRMEKIIEDLKNEIMYEHLPIGSVTTFLGKDVGYWYGMDAKIKRYEDALRFIANGCLVPPDGGSPVWPDDAIEAARKALEQ